MTNNEQCTKFNRDKKVKKNDVKNNLKQQNKSLENLRKIIPQNNNYKKQERSRKSTKNSESVKKFKIWKTGNKGKRGIKQQEMRNI